MYRSDWSNKILNQLLINVICLIDFLKLPLKTSIWQYYTTMLLIFLFTSLLMSVAFTAFPTTNSPKSKGVVMNSETDN